MIELYRERLGGLNDLLSEEESAFVNGVFLSTRRAHQLVASGFGARLRALVHVCAMNSPHAPFPCSHHS